MFRSKLRAKSTSETKANQSKVMADDQKEIKPNRAEFRIRKPESNLFIDDYGNKSLYAQIHLFLDKSETPQSGNANLMDQREIVNRNCIDL